ncbi:MAG: mechanosensitive ion channel [Chlamydiia bacterium]|nr:mechanosensitive ion channel [Chlamydiia bacterium]
MPENRCLYYCSLLGFVLLIFLGAFIVYGVLFYFFQKIFKEGGITRKLIRSLRLPTFFLFIELAAFLSINLFDFPTLIDETVSQMILILCIGTVGWLLYSLVAITYRHLMLEYEDLSKVDLSKRSIITQLQFLYRGSTFLIILLSLASILITFPSIKSVGVGILGSAGIAGIALGIAARPILLNFMAGFQIAVTKVIKIGDSLVVEGEWGRVEHIYLTHVVLQIWDLRRLVIPISYFVDNAFQNWTTRSTDLIGVAFFYVDYTVPVDKIREKFYDILQQTPEWDQKIWKLQVTDITDRAVQLRAVMSAKDGSDAFALRAIVREKLLDFLQANYPHALPQIRLEKKSLVST